MIETTDTTFPADVLASPVPVLVLFSATWCAPCKAMQPHLEQIAKDYAGKLTVVKCDVANGQNTAARYGATTLPTVVLFRHGGTIDGFMGARPAAAVRAMLERNGVTA